MVGSTSTQGRGRGANARFIECWDASDLKPLRPVRSMGFPNLKKKDLYYLVGFRSFSEGV